MPHWSTQAKHVHAERKHACMRPIRLGMACALERDIFFAKNHLSRLSGHDGKQTRTHCVATRSRVCVCVCASRSSGHPGGLHAVTSCLLTCKSLRRCFGRVPLCLYPRCMCMCTSMCICVHELVGMCVCHCTLAH